MIVPFQTWQSWLHFLLTYRKHHSVILIRTKSLDPKLGRWTSGRQAISTCYLDKVWMVSLDCYRLVPCINKHFVVLCSYGEYAHSVLVDLFVDFPKTFPTYLKRHYKETVMLMVISCSKNCHGPRNAGIPQEFFAGNEKIKISHLCFS